MAKLFVGTSGWVYKDWDGKFYPKGLKYKDKLSYFAKHFNTVEINYSFYRLPRPTTYKNWYSQTPKDFVFAVKVSRFITHVKRLKNVKTAWRTFLENASRLEEKLGPILFQFPPNFKATEKNIKRLERFLGYLDKRQPRKEIKDFLRGRQTTDNRIKYAFEFRDPSWFDRDIYKLFRKHKIALVIADSPKYPILRLGSGQEAEIITADFVYVRMHAPTPERALTSYVGARGIGARLVRGHASKGLFSSKYTDKELKNLARKTKKWLKSKLDVYVYFNNDAFGHAVENAKKLTKYL